MKILFVQVHALMDDLTAMEYKLRALRDQVDSPIKREINHTLVETAKVRDQIWRIDKALEVSA